MRTKYPVVIHKSRFGYDAYCPILPGCATQGETLKEVSENIKDAIESYLSALIKVKRNESIRYTEVSVGV